MFSGLVGCGTILVSTIVAFMIAFGIGTGHEGALVSENPVLDHIWTWIQVGGFRADFGLGMDRLSGVYALFVTFVGLPFTYSRPVTCTATAGFIVFRVFEFVHVRYADARTGGQLSVDVRRLGGRRALLVLLIGCYLKKDAARKAAKKAFVMNRIGDWGVLIGNSSFYFDRLDLLFDKTVDGQRCRGIQLCPREYVTEPFTWGAIVAVG